ncbi:hypothetical protein BKA70DRAFT_1228463 [Coprinopsis sp. MPI-PUGE-AT-0042]|nr:hypothetical protein BKA70DRAFT_1228463 [Coprinopsis sp. MPI-PUGE-AT-0042]
MPRLADSTRAAPRGVGSEPSLFFSYFHHLPFACLCWQNFCLFRCFGPLNRRWVLEFKTPGRRMEDDFRILKFAYSVRDSVEEYEADLRLELHEETPESEPFLEDLSCASFYRRASAVPDGAETFALNSEDPVDDVGKIIDNDAIIGAVDGIVGTTLDGPVGEASGAKKSKPRRKRSSLGKSGKGSKQALGKRQELEAPDVKWRWVLAFCCTILC